ncbi:MAG: response regulator [Candidatus Eremiobacterota bacterium]
MINKRILIVEDEKLTVEMLTYPLEQEGFEIISASDGEEGLLKAYRDKPSLIILDIMLPKLNGIEVCKRLKNDFKTKNIPLIMLTCRDDMDFKLESFRNGADDYIIKPFDLRELLAKVKSILRLINLQNTLKASIEEVERISVINEINKAISSSLYLEEILKIIGCQIRRLINYDLISLALLDKGDKFVKVRTLISQEKIELGDEFYIPVNISTLSQNLISGTICNPSEDKVPELPCAGEELLSAIIIPLKVRRKIIGTFNVAGYRENAFSETELEVANQIALQVAIAMENARLYEHVSELANITTNAPLAIVGTDNNSIITSWNKGAETIFGYKSEEIIGKSSQILIPDDLKIQRNELLSEALRKGILEEINTERITGSGTRIHVKITYTVIKDEKGKIIGLAHIIRNIEKEIELQRQLIQSEKLSTMGQLVSGVAHELNNPLTGIIGFSELLMLEADKSIYKDLKRIQEEAARARRIVQNLLSFARMHKPEKTKIDINGIIKNVLELKSYEMRVDNIEIKCNLDQNLPVTMGDPHQLQQVFLNIINNAHQAVTSASRSGVMNIKTCKKEASIIIEFSDTGPGISKENLTRIFDPFFTTKEVGKGTGLGLSLSYGIIKDHGGTIHAVSEEGEGAIFTIALPIIENNIVFPARNIPGLNQHIRDFDILVIDDEDTVLQLFDETLTREGNRVELARDGQSALERISNKGYFDIIICDVKMPSMNGRELFELLKEQKPELAENFIFMSGAINKLESLNFFNHEVNPFLEKPFSINEALRAISRLVNKDKKTFV